MCEIVKAINYTAFDSEWNCSSFSPKKKKKKKKKKKDMKDIDYFVLK